MAYRLLDQYCTGGNIDLLDDLLNVNIHKDNDMAFRLCCQNGNITVAKWLFETYPNIDVRACGDYAFKKACKNGHKNVAKWLLEINTDININDDREYAFRMSCGHGFLDVAKWLYKKTPNMNHNAMCNSFIWSCYHGHLEIAKWLCKTGTCIDIHQCEEEYFMAACYRNNSKILKWMLEKWPDINIYTRNYHAFIYANEYNFVETLSILAKHPVSNTHYLYYSNVAYILNPLVPIDDYIAIKIGDNTIYHKPHITPNIAILNDYLNTVK
jgi:hypothetical protein